MSLKTKVRLGFGAGGLACAVALASFQPGAVTAQTSAASAANSPGMESQDKKIADGNSPPVSSDMAQQKGLAAKALDAAKNAANKAGDILTRVPCLSPKGPEAATAYLPHVARKLNASEPVTIVAFGSSSTQGYGSTSPAYNYPNRLADQLRRKFPKSEITIINRGVGGQDVPQMMDRLQTSVLDEHPDLVIWQLGTNSVVRGDDTSGTAALVESGVSRIQAIGADVVLIDPQYVPAVTAKPEGASRMVKLIKDIAVLKKVSVFPRFEVMRHWHEDEKLPFDTFVIGDGLHMNDWGYACFAQLLGDTIIRSVEQIKAGTVPDNAAGARPM
ncbi:MAG: SGNH/GDSL hydrolase family protein [Bradyrhizobiaceae bacterium]|nr:MAG: SGNH/GDSL hydrolase family protein [Bradyrhizobiaceae bacterium]